MLSKIQKQGNPGRLIKLNCGTLTEELSSFIENILKPLVSQRVSFLQNTTDFLKSIQNISYLPNKATLATIYITRMYTNIPRQEGTDASQQYGVHSD